MDTVLSQGAHTRGEPAHLDPATQSSSFVQVLVAMTLHSGVRRLVSQTLLVVSVHVVPVGQASLNAAVASAPASSIDSNARAGSSLQTIFNSLARLALKKEGPLCSGIWSL